MLDVIESKVVDGVRENLSHPALLAEYIKAYREERRATIAEAARNRDRVARRLGDVKASIDRYIKAIGRGTLPVEAVEGEIAKLEEERKVLVAELAVAESAVPVVELHPQAIERYRRDVEMLHERINDLAAGGNTAPMQAFRALVSSVIVTPAEEGRIEIEVRGRLAELLGADVPAPFRGWSEVVAEEGLEPPTRGL